MRNTSFLVFSVCLLASASVDAFSTTPRARPAFVTTPQTTIKTTTTNTRTTTKTFPSSPLSSSSFSKSNSALFAKGGSLSCRPIGIGSASPKTIVTNVDLESVVETSDEWIRTRTGISERHLLQQGEYLRDLSVQASQNALDMAGIAATDLDMVICACSTADDMFGDATTIASNLGCTTETFAYDLVAACSGFLFGTVTAGKFLSAPNGETKYALVVGADALSRWIDWDDRNSCILFGDASGAMVLKVCEGEEGPGILGYAAHSNGNGYGDLNCGFNGAPRFIATPGDGTTVADGSFGKLVMRGKEVYKFATREVPTVIEEALTAGGLTVDDIDWLLLHQANIRIMEVVASRLGVPMSKVITNLSKYGNTSSASIPLALDEAVREGKVKKGDVIACAGFGAGLSWGAAIFKWG